MLRFGFLRVAFVLRKLSNKKDTLSSAFESVEVCLLEHARLLYHSGLGGLLHLATLEPAAHGCEGAGADVGTPAPLCIVKEPLYGLVCCHSILHIPSCLKIPYP